MSKSCDYCFTWNNRTVAEVTMACLTQTTDTPGSIAYCRAQAEVGDSGTPHVQGFIQFGSARSLGFCKKLLPGAHFEKRRGSATQANDYCNKPLAEGGNDAPAWETGVFDAKDRQGARLDVTAFKEAIKAGATDEVCGGLRLRRRIGARCPGIWDLQWAMGPAMIFVRARHLCSVKHRNPNVCLFSAFFPGRSSWTSTRTAGSATSAW